MDKFERKKNFPYFLLLGLVLLIITDHFTGMPFQEIYYLVRRKYYGDRRWEVKSRLDKLEYYLKIESMITFELKDVKVDKSDPYYWITFLKEKYPTRFETEIKPFLYVSQDWHKKSFPSSFIANTKLIGIDNEKYQIVNEYDIVLLAERNNFVYRDRRFVLFLRGGIKTVKESEFEDIMNREPELEEWKEK